MTKIPCWAAASVAGALLLGVAQALQAQAAAACDPVEATIPQLQEAMRAGGCTARSLVEAHLRRIDELDRRGPALHSILELNPDAISIAEALDQERAAGRIRGPLHGIPVVIKGNIATADRMSTTAGALALQGSIAPRDAYVVERLRAAGAVILGKSNLSEWANFRSTRSSSGWSALGGQTRNPYVLDRSPCGSSSGTGAAVAAGLAVAGLGTETDGSIVCPAGATGLVGIKPTVGLVSRSGIIPISHSQDTAGPMARTVTDAALLLGVLTGRDPTDAATAPADAGAHADYTRFLDPDGLRGARIGVARKGLFGYSREADRVADAAIESMRSSGAVIVDSLEIPALRDFGDDEFTVLLYEFKDGVDRYLASLGPGAPVRSLAEVIAFNERNRERSMPFFQQEILEMAQAKGALDDREYREALERSRRLARMGLDSVMSRHRLDAVLAPTGQPAWPIDLLNGDHYLGASSSPAAVSGYPNITVPAGVSHGIPIGVSLIGRPWSEPVLIRLAYSFEQTTRHRRPPDFLPTLDLTPR